MRVPRTFLPAAKRQNQTSVRTAQRCSESTLRTTRAVLLLLSMTLRRFHDGPMVSSRGIQLHAPSDQQLEARIRNRRDARDKPSRPCRCFVSRKIALCNG